MGRAAARPFFWLVLFGRVRAKASEQETASWNVSRADRCLIGIRELSRKRSNGHCAGFGVSGFARASGRAAGLILIKASVRRPAATCNELGSWRGDYGELQPCTYD